MLGECDAHIWLAPTTVVEDAACKERCLRLLDADERASYARFMFDRDREIYLTGHALVRTVLSRYGSRPPDAWRFVRNEHGRPEPIDARSLRFNLSHTRGMAACLVVHQVDAGVDVEQRRDRDSLLNIATRFFSPIEVGDLMALPERDRLDRFFELWTLKESYIKARGMGLALPLASFSYRFADGGVTLSTSQELNDDGAQWQCAFKRLSDEHQLAWAIRADGRSFDVEVRTMPTDELGA